MSIRTMACSSSNRNSASDLASSVLPTPVGPRNRNEPVGRFGSEMPARERRTASDTARTAGCWPTNRCADPGLHAQQLLGLTLQQPARRDAGPVGHDLGDVGRSDLLRHHRRQLALGLRGLGHLALQSRDLAVAEFARAAEIALTQGAIGGGPQLVDLLLQIADPVEALLLGLPAGLQRPQFFLDVGQILGQLAQPFDAAGVGLLLQGEFLHLHPLDRAAQHVDLLRGGVDLHPQPGCRLVDQVDRLVGKLPGGDVAIGQARGRDQGGVGDGDLVMGLVPLPQTAQNRDGVLDARLADEDLLEAPLQGRILLDPLRGTRPGWWRRSSAAHRAPASA